MARQSYRIISATLGILSIEGNRSCVTVPTGATVAVTSGPLDGNRLVDVAWGVTDLMMFTQDLRNRAEPILRTPHIELEIPDIRSESYGINSPSLAILSRSDGKRLPITVPIGAVVTVVEGPLNGARVVEVEWDGDSVLMFSEELRENGTLLSQSTAASAV
jgi:hypothetical protein